jgi:hypothetical protein
LISFPGRRHEEHCSASLAVILKSFWSTRVASEIQELSNADAASTLRKAVEGAEGRTLTTVMDNSNNSEAGRRVKEMQMVRIARACEEVVYIRGLDLDGIDPRQEQTTNGVRRSVFDFHSL